MYDQFPEHLPPFRFIDLFLKEETDYLHQNNPDYAHISFGTRSGSIEIPVEGFHSFKGFSRWRREGAIYVSTYKDRKLMRWSREPFNDNPTMWTMKERAKGLAKILAEDQKIPTFVYSPKIGLSDEEKLLYFLENGEVKEKRFK